MVETTAQIATHIEATREHLGANLDALEQKIKSATDWREYFQSSPMTVVGAAFAGGVLLAMATGTRPRRVSGSTRAISNHALPPRPMGPHAQEVVTMIDNVKGALIGMAATRVKDLVADVLPGFRDEFDRRQRASASTGA
jgi:hypothetical protein